jgi:hypothetical protein
MEENTPQKNLTAVCIEAGIKREFTVPYNPQQNGVARKEKQNYH